MHTRPALLLALVLGLSLTAACGDNDPIVLEDSPDPEPTPDPTPDPMPNMDPGVTPGPTPDPEPTPDPNPDAPPRPSSEVMGGEATGLWEGDVRLLSSVIVPAGQTLTIAADTVVDVVSETERVTIEVEGTLVIDGSATARVAIGSEDGWGGIVVSGSMNGAGLDISGAERCVLGQMNSDIVLTDATFIGCGASLALANGGTFDRTTIIGGSTIRITGGILRMTDSTVDFGTDGNVPDCTKWDRGGAVLDHVRFTGCHCPLHFNAATEEVSITNSIFDRATYPAMVAQMTGTFTGNHFLGGTNHILDIGGNFDIDIANNYWDGGAPNLSSADLSQFRGSATFSNTPFPNAGPR